MKRILVIVFALFTLQLFAKGTDSLPLKFIVPVKNGVKCTAKKEIPLQLRCKVETNVNAPLIIVDGAACEKIDQLNPEEIKSIDVLNYNTASALFGGRAKNGVILITTMKRQDSLIVIRDKEDGRALAGATVKLLPGKHYADSVILVADKNGCIASNALGQVHEGVAIVSCIGYEPREIELSFEQKARSNIVQLQRVYKKQEEVVVIAYSRSRRIICCCSGVKIIRENLSLRPKSDLMISSVYPNPVKNNGIVRIQLQDPVNGSLQLFNSVGNMIDARMIATATGKLIEYNLPGTSPGTYFIRINDQIAGKIITEKLVVQ